MNVHGIRDYTLVSGACLLLNNAILIAMDRAGSSLPAAVSLSFVIVVVVSYVLHSRFTFGAALRLTSFAQYAIAMAANIPLTFAMLWFWGRFVGLRVEFAAPIATGCMASLNYVLCRFTMSGRGRASPKPLPAGPMVQR